MRLIACLLFLFAAAPLHALTLVENGQPRAYLWLPAEPHADEQLAADEIARHVEQIGGAKLPVEQSDQPAAAGARIAIGGRADAGLLGPIQGKDRASFVLQVDAAGASLRGNSPEGTLFAAYELLEQLGVRWFMPGETGTIVPAARTLDLKPQTTAQVPSFAGRWHNAGGADRVWGRRVRMGGPYFPSAHGLPLGADATFDKHPEYYSLYNGNRIRAQHCVSNPEVVRLVVEQTKAYFRKNPNSPWLGMGPNDGAGFCQCENCKALDAGDWDPFSAEPSTTDRYIWFFNQVLAGIEDEFPDKKICFYSYHTYMRPPLKTPADPRIVPALAPIALCRVHGPNNPVCPESHYYPWLIEAWKQVLPEVYDRGYWFNLADPGFPFSMVHRLRVQVPLARKAGIAGWRVETMHHWGSEMPSLYLAARLMWNADADVDALERDFYETFFGPAAGPMAAYGKLMDEALRDADHHTGCSFDMPHFYPAELRAQADALLQDAAAQAGPPDAAYAQRVAIFRSTFDYLQAFIAMIEHRNAFDFVAAKTALDQLDALQKRLIGHDPPLINARSAPAYLTRFFRATTEQGFARTTGGNRLVAACDDQWDFLIDADRVGEDLGYHLPELRGGNWQKLKTASSSWSNQGLRYYKGEAWYRQAVEVPEQFAGRRVFLWFGGVDDKAKVWLNGKELGISHASEFIPFEFDATAALRPGRNVIAVRIVNTRVDELGTGGILAPVMLYAPAAGAEAQVENAAPMGRTFP